MKSKIQQQAWKEKVALCSIALILGGIVGFATIGLNRTLCPADQNNQENDFIRLGEQAGNDYKELQTQS
jgi:chitin synthase